MHLYHYAYLAATGLLFFTDCALGFVPKHTTYPTAISTALDLDARKSITFQYSPSSLKHLEAVELPPDYSRPWTKEKTIAITGAFLIGGISTAAGGFAANVLLGDDKAGILVGGVGTALGWYLFGGGAVMESEKLSSSKNGGYDAKLVADRPARLQTILDDLKQEDLIVEQSAHGRDLSTALEYIHLIHGEEYEQLLKMKCEDTDRPVRFNPIYARTLIDEFSYDAAINAVQDWMDSVDTALDRNRNMKPRFALARPPGHHACRSKGMGGCLFNAAAISAFYALSQPGVNNVAILDIDAHHGNGIGHCVQDEPRIRYCSIHEAKDSVTGNAFIERKIPEDDPRTQDSDDNGPLLNLCNINLKTGTGWETGYKTALIETALPFLLENKPDLLIVSAGFDALQTDWSSGLMMQPADYKGIGQELRAKFGDKVAMGLEGGYSFQNHALSNALMEFCSAWNE